MKVKKAFGRKLLSVISAWSLLTNQLLPIAAALIPAPAYAQEATQAEPQPLSFDAASDSFTFPKAENQTVNYLFAYRTDKDQTEVVLGQKEPIYAGTCSAGGNCVNHAVLHGILKTQAENAAEVKALRFALDRDQVVIVSEETAASLELSDGENSWLETYAYQPAASPSPTPLPSPSSEPSPSPSPEPVNPSPSPELIETDSSPPGVLSAIIINSSDLPEFDLTATEPISSATLTTDKPDYTPSEIVVISGTNFTPNQTYTLVISSDDEPAIRFETSVTADSGGNFIYDYQLDGTYRPNYLVEAFDAKGGLVALVTFTDSPVCQNDVNGANDLAGQKDLSRMCADAASLPTTLNVTWNWDDVGWTGSNTGDGCALFDTNGDGKANNALCVTVGGTPATYQSKTLYACNDTKTDRCGSPNSTLSPSASTTCGASVQSADPFPAGDASPNDTVANCSIAVADISAATATLIDVCSYPSSEPNSAPSDCIIATSASTGKLEIVKDLIPSSDSGLFNLQVDGSTLVNDVSDGGTTGEQVVLSSDGSGTPHTFGETAGTGTSLSDYTATTACLNATGASVSTTGTNPWIVNVGNNADIVCTITNTLNTGSVIVNKLVDADGNGTYEGGNTEANGLGFDWGLDAETPARDMGTTATNVPTGSHNVTEDSVTGYHFVGWYLNSDTSKTCANTTNTTLPASINVATGQTTAVTFCNARDTGTIKVVKQTDPDGSPVEFTFTGNLAGQIADGGELALNVPTGSYSSTETVPSGWVLSSIVCDDTNSTGDTGTATATFNVETDETVTCTFTNTQNGHIIVDKVTDPTGSSQSFNFVTTGGTYANFSLTDAATPNDQELVPGVYGVAETVPDDWDQTSASCSDQSPIDAISLQAGETITCTFTNTQRGSISGYKYEDADGDGSTLGDQTVLSGWVIELWKLITDQFVYQDQDTTDVNGYFSFENLLPGLYQLREQLQTGWTKILPTGDGIDVTLNPGESDQNNNFINFENVDITVCKVADADGDDQTSDDQTPVAGWQVDLIKDGQTIDDTQVTGENGCYIWTNLGPGDYSVSEETQTGWQNLNDTTHNFGSVQSGDQLSHTFVNTQMGKIIVVKQTVPDQTAGIFDFTADYDADGFSLSDGGQNDSGYLMPGTYSVAETEPDGWELISATCDDQSDPGLISLQAGGTVTCTFTNGQLPKLTVTKIVINDDGGTKQVADFPLFVDGNGVVSGETNTYQPDDYLVSETGDPGYAAAIGGACDGQGNVALAYGDNKTCSITNDDIAPTLTLVKEVTNEVGTPADASEWTLSATGDGGFSGSGPTVGPNNVLAGETYALSESGGATGYSPSSWDCDGGIQDGDSINLALDEDVTCIITNTRDTGNLTVHKLVQTTVDGDFVSADPGDFTWGLAEGDTSYAMGSTQTLETGDYDVYENSVGDYHPVGWYFTDGEGSCDEPDEAELPANVTVSQEGTDITVCNTRDTGNITVVKNIDYNNDGDLDDPGDQTNAGGWTWDIDSGEQDIAMGESRTLITGDYTITEDEKPGEYALVSWSCDNEMSGTANTIALSLNPDDQITCQFTNTPLSDVHGYKWEDVNGNGQPDEGENRLGGWTIFLDGNDNGQLDEGEPSTETGNEGEDLGWYWFYDLPPGDYRLCEVTPPGWKQTYPTDPDCHEITLPENGELTENQVTAVEHNFGNRLMLSILTITKTNNASGDKAPGDSVMFTLTITATQSAATNVVLTDLPAGGFTYQTGTWTYSSNLNPALVVGEPSYASPGKWNLGNMQENETITLTYLAQISGSQAPGQYTDLAWVQGESLSGDAVLAQAENPGYIDTNFVGTQVKVITDDHDSLTQTGQVLGAATELPATGAQTFWLILALTMIAGGASSLKLGLKLKKKYD